MCVCELVQCQRLFYRSLGDSALSLWCLLKRKTVCNEQFAAEHCGNAGVWMEALIVMFSGLCMHIYSVERLYVAFYLWFLLFSVFSYLILEYYKWLSKKCLQYWQLLFIYFFKYFKLSL